MLAILEELCWLEFFKTVYLETSNVRFGSFFQNPATYVLHMQIVFIQYSNSTEYVMNMKYSLITSVESHSITVCDTYAYCLKYNICSGVYVTNMYTGSHMVCI